MQEACVYWIRKLEHTDMFTQGYVGVSSNYKRRWSDHKFRGHNLHLKNAVAKYGWDNLIKEQILISTDEYCLDIESKLRPANGIGWNIIAGGGKPPLTKWNLGKKHSEETKLKIGQSRKGKAHSLELQAKLLPKLLENNLATRFQKGMVPSNKGKPQLPHVIEAVRQSRLGKKNTEEHKAKISVGLMGHLVSNETKEKIRQANIGKIQPMTGQKFSTTECPHCHKIGGINCMQRWHFNNCKLKD